MLKAQFLSSMILCVLSISSCARMPRDNGEEYVTDIVASRIGKDVQWNRLCYEDPQIQAYIHDLVNVPLSSEAAIQIALLHNPHIQAFFEEIGIAQADLVEAGLLSNPVFEIEVRYPHKQKLVTNIEYLVTATFLDIFLIPLRKKLANVELEQATLRVSNEILNLSFQVRQTYYELVAEMQKLQYTINIVELISIHNEIVFRQKQVENVNLLDFQIIQARFLEANLEIARSRSEIIRLREKLNRLLGFGNEVCLMLPEELPDEMDYSGFNLCSLELIAIEHRLDLQVARLEVARIGRMLGLKDWWSYTNLNAGLAGERDPDGVNLVGFGVAGAVPIFNYGQAARIRLFAQLRQARDRLAALEIQVLSEVREAHKLLMNDLFMINDYKSNILPIQQNILKSSEELYNVMGLGIDRLLENKRQEMEAFRHYYEIVKNYWTARVQLDRALGGYLFLLLPQDCEKEL